MLLSETFWELLKLIQQVEKERKITENPPHLHFIQHHTQDHIVKSLLD